MATFKLAISDTRGRSTTHELKDAEANQLIGAAIGTELDAAAAGLAGKITITGGSDKSGVPMRGDVHGGSRKYVMLSRGVGLPHAGRGERVRKLVRGREITEEVFQVNCLYDGTLEDPKAAGDSPGDSAGEGSGDAPAKSAKDDVGAGAADGPKEQKA